MGDILQRRKDNYELSQIHRRSLISAAKRLHKEGKKAKEISEELGVAESTIRNIIYK